MTWHRKELRATRNLIKTLALVAIGLLAVLQVVDVLTTNAVVRIVGTVAEANPLSRFLLGGPVVAVKVALIVALGIRLLWSKKVATGVCCGLWTAVGFYAAVALSNSMILVRL